MFSFLKGEPGFIGPQGEPGLPGLPGTKVSLTFPHFLYLYASVQREIKLRAFF